MTSFFPELSHIEQAQNFSVFHTTGGVQGIYFHLPLIDLDGLAVRSQLSAVQSCLRDLEPGIFLKVRSSYSLCDTKEVLGNGLTAPSKAILGHEILLGFEQCRTQKFKLFLKGKSSRNLTESLPTQSLQTLGVTPLSKEETEDLFLLPQDLRRSAKFLDRGDEVIGILRVFRQGTQELSEDTLAILSTSLPLPFEVSVTIRKLSKQDAEWRLRSRLARQATEQDSTTQARMGATEEAIAATTLEARTLVELEWLLVMRRFSQADLRRDLASAKAVLKTLGDVLVESIGCVPSFRASLAGSSPHHSFLEFDDASTLYLPVFAYGEAMDAQIPLSPRALLLDREDGSLHLFDLFSPKFLASNCIISGKTGSGKSVLANALSSALMCDPNVVMCKIDVGGSYRKECELIGGEEVTFSMQQPSGVDPFRYLHPTNHSNDVVDTLSTFLACLLREEAEKSVPKTLASEIADLVQQYAKQKHRASLNDFYVWSPPFSRKALLKRWCTGGVFENALKEREGKKLSARYRYFNFESIQNAANSDFAEGVMAACIASINLEMLALGEARASGTRFVLVCDETKFFIERNAQFFLLTSANFRKFGHAVILITQSIQNFDLDLGFGRTDSGIILNSPVRFFLEQDTERPYLATKFGLEDRHLKVITDEPYRGKAYREMVLQDDTGTRVVRLSLSAEEYWRVTSTWEDNERLRALRGAVPGLSLEGAIRCLSLVG